MAQIAPLSGGMSELTLHHASHSDQLKTCTKAAWKGHEFTDDTWYIGHEEIKVHRVIVSGGSPFFFTMYHGSRAEHEDCIETLQEQNPKMVRSALEFLYTGETRVQPDRMVELARTTVPLRMTELFLECKKSLLACVCPSNCIDILLLGLNRADKELTKAGKQFAVFQFSEVAKLEGSSLNDMPFETLNCYIREQWLQMDSENQILRVVKRWVQSNVEYRAKELNMLLKLVHLPQVDKDAIIHLYEWCKTTTQNNLLVQAAGTLNGFLQTGEFEKKEARNLPTLVVFNAANVRDGVINTFCPHKQDYIGKLKTKKTSKDQKPSIKQCSAAKDHTKACYVSGRVYLIGYGDGNDEIWSYDLMDSTWTKCTCTLVTGRRHHEVLWTGAFIFIFGGRAVGRASDGGSCVLGSVEKFDISQETCSQVGSLCEPVMNTAAISSPNSQHVYLLGGENRPPRSSFFGLDITHYSVKTIQCFDTASNQCTRVAAELPFEETCLCPVLTEANTYLLLGARHSGWFTLQNKKCIELDKLKVDSEWFAVAKVPTGPEQARITVFTSEGVIQLTVTMGATQSDQANWSWEKSAKANWKSFEASTYVQIRVPPSEMIFGN